MSNTQNEIRLDLDLPFTPDIHEVIYVENEYHPAINAYIQEHYETIQRMFLEKDAVFIYLPKLCHQNVTSEVLHYMFPHLKQPAPFENGNLSIETIKEHLIKGAIEGPALIHFIRMYEYPPKDYFFTYRPIESGSDKKMTEQLTWYLERLTFAVGGGRVFFSLKKPEEDEIADFGFDDNDEDLLSRKSTQQLTDEIKARLIELRKRGVQKYLLKELVEEKPTLSRLVITEDYRILLPDYDNTEITMAPLPKAVFLLFLKHPEGIVFKQLSDYRSELLGIYKSISNRIVELKIKKSIRDITDPSKNSINEKCARIREAFLEHFDTTYAQYYYITGKRGEPKKITLPRELVDIYII